MSASPLSWRFLPRGRVTSWEGSWWSWEGSSAGTAAKADPPCPGAALYHPHLTAMDFTGTDPDTHLQISACYVKKGNVTILSEEKIFLKQGLSFSKRYYRKASEWIRSAFNQSPETVQSSHLGTELIILGTRQHSSLSYYFHVSCFFSWAHHSTGN